MISRSIQSQNYFSTHVCSSDNYDLLQLIFDTNKVPNGVGLSVDELSFAVTSIKDLRILDFLIKQLKLNKDNIYYHMTTDPEIKFVIDALEFSIKENNLLVFSHLFENYSLCSAEENHQKNFVHLIYQYQSSDIASYFFNSPFINSL